MTEEEKKTARSDAQMLNKRDMSEYIRWLLELGHFVAVTQAKYQKEDYLITQEKFDKWIDDRLKTHKVIK